MDLDVDRILRAQGANPKSIRARSKILMDIAERALAEGSRLIEPKVLYERLRVRSIRHKRISLEGGFDLQGCILVQHMASAEEVVIAYCTIGERLEAYSSEAMKDDLVFGLALDGLGSAAAEELGNAFCEYVDQQAAKKAWLTGIPLGPGMIGWSVEEGQKQLSAIVDPRRIGVNLTNRYVMLPRKSISFVLGIGSQIANVGSTCEFCSMKDTCRYRDHYAKL